jgi:hypothetical protein
MPDANPIFDLGNPIWIAVVAVAETPAEMLPYAGRFLSIPNESVLPPLGTRGIVKVSDVSVPGYLRQGIQFYEWVMMPLVDPLLAMVDGIPGLVGWSDPGAKGTWRSIADTLRGYGVSSQDLAVGLPALYNSARTNLLQEYGVS